MTLTQVASVDLNGVYNEFAIGKSDPTITGTLFNTKFIGISFTPAPFAQNKNRLFPVAPPPFDSLSFGLTLYGGQATDAVLTASLITSTSFGFFSSSAGETPADFTVRTLTVTPATFSLGAPNPLNASFVITAGPADLTAINNTIKASGWKGTIGIRVTAAPLSIGTTVVKNSPYSGGNVPILTTATATQEVEDVRGKSGLGEFGTVDRVRECPRCGNFLLETEMQLDGYRKGLLVCPDCWDPPDRRLGPLPGIRRGSY